MDGASRAAVGVALLIVTCTVPAALAAPPALLLAATVSAVVVGLAVHPPLGGGAFVAALLGASTSRPTSRPSHSATGAGLTSGAVQRWSDDQLRDQWRVSSALLDARVLGPRGLARVAAHRSVHLDEFDRRDPAAFAAWLADGPRAGSDPLAPRPPREPIEVSRPDEPGEPR